MNHRRRLLASCFTVAAAALAAVGLAAAAPPPNGPSGGPSGGRTFEISGSVDGLVPLVERPLALKVENDERRDIVVDSLIIEVADAGPGCDADNLVLGPAPVPFGVPGRGEVTITFTASLRADASNACQGQTFPLVYRGTATQG